jgi:hypothetical protein
MKNIKKIYNQSKNHYDFFEEIESKGRLIFEELVAVTLKATLPGDVYWLGEDPVPSTVSIKYNFESILDGKNSTGCDIVQVHNDEAIGFESKHFDDRDSIPLDKVTTKSRVIDQTGISRLVFCTNASRFSSQVQKWEPNVGILDKTHWFTKDNYVVIGDYIKKQKKKKYEPLKPWNTDQENAVDMFESYIIATVADGKQSWKILLPWPAAVGKGAVPRLCFDRVSDKIHDFKKEHPVNVFVNPNLTVTKTNLQKQLIHDRALNTNCEHIIFAGDIRDSQDKEILELIRADATVLTDEKDWVEKLRQTKNKTINVHTTPHSYSKCAKWVKKERGGFLFGQLDEAHRYYQPDWSRWIDCLNDSVCPIILRIEGTASRKFIRGACKFKMFDADYDWVFPELKEKDAAKKRYKRATKVTEYIFRESDFPKNWMDEIYENNMPLLNLKGTDIVVPKNWFMSAVALILWRIENPQRKYIKLSLNKIDHLSMFEKFFNAVKRDILRKYLHSNDPLYREILNSPFILADSKKLSTTSILREVDAVPKNYPQGAFIAHCFLLGEGWDPENGWLLDSHFVDSVNSSTRIYQDHNRTTRIGDGRFSESNVIVAAYDGQDIENKNPYNEMFAPLLNIAKAMEIGEEEIIEDVTFKVVKKIPTKRKNKKKTVGVDQNSNLDITDVDVFTKAFATYMREGHYHRFGSVVNELFTDLHRLWDERMAWLHRFQAGEIYKILGKDKKYEGYLKLKKQSDRLKAIFKGNNIILSEENQTKGVELQIHYDKKLEQYKQNIINDYIEIASKIAFPVAKKLGEYNSKGKYPVHQLKAVRYELDKKYKFTEWSTKNDGHYPANIRKLLRVESEKLVDVWRDNYQAVLDKVIELCNDPELNTKDKLSAEIKKFTDTFYHWKISDMVSALSENHGKSRTLKKTIAKIYGKDKLDGIVNAIETFKKHKRPHEWSDQARDKRKKTAKLQEKDVAQTIKDSGVIEFLLKNGSNNKYNKNKTYGTGWKEDAFANSKLPLKGSWIQKWIFSNEKTYYRPLIGIDVTMGQQLDDFAKKFRAQANSDVHSGQLPWQKDPANEEKLRKWKEQTSALSSKRMKGNEPWNKGKKGYSTAKKGQKQKKAV